MVSVILIVQMSPGSPPTLVLFVRIWGGRAGMAWPTESAEIT